MTEEICDTDFYREVLKGYIGDLRWDEPLAPYTSLKVGGPVNVMVFPSDVTELVFLLEQIGKHQLPYFVLGGGSNLLIKDGGIGGIVFNLRQLNKIEAVGFDFLMAEGGASYPKVATFAMENDLGGLEFAVGIPGTVGGAITMNAGVPGAETSEAVISVTLVKETGEISEIPVQEVGFSYRGTKLPKGIIFAAGFRLTPTPKTEIEEKIKIILKKRRDLQPLNLSNCGSVFKNPPNGFAGDLIEKSGLKGYCIGGAEISTLHANFVVNKGGAKASDFIALIEKMQQTVFERFDVELEPEVKIVGREIS